MKSDINLKSSWRLIAAVFIILVLLVAVPVGFLVGNHVRDAAQKEVAKTPAIAGSAVARYKVGKLSPDEDAIHTTLPLETYPITEKTNVLAAIDRAEHDLKARGKFTQDHTFWFSSLRRAVDKGLPIEIHVTQQSVMEFYCLLGSRKVLAANPFYEDGDYYTLAELYGSKDFYEKAITPNDACF